MHAPRIAAGGMLVTGMALASVARAQGSRGRAAAPAPAPAPVTVPRFEVDPLWPLPLPHRWILGSSTGVAVDAGDHVFLVHLTDSFNRRTEIGLATDPPTGECCAPAPNVLELDPAGHLVHAWGGAGQGYTWPEMAAGLAVDDSGNVWIGGSGGEDSQILKFSHDGRFIAQFGTPAAPPAEVAASTGDTAYQGVSPARGAVRAPAGGRARRPALPPNSNSLESFGGPAGFSFDTRANEAYVADGYRNHRVAVIDMTTGAIKRTWGAYGQRPVDADSVRYDPNAPPAKQFSTVRCAKLSRDALVYVCDARNDRIQVFRRDGSFVAEARVAPQTLGAGSVWDIAFSRDPAQRYLYVADGMNMKVHVLDRRSLRELTSFGDGGRQPGEFYAVHSVATDSRGDLYTVETYEGKRVQKFVYKGIGAPAHAAVLWPSAGGAR